MIDEILRERSWWMGAHQGEGIQDSHGSRDDGGLTVGTHGSVDRRQETNDHEWRVGRVLHVGEFEKVFRQVLSERCSCWGGQSPRNIMSPSAPRPPGRFRQVQRVG